MSSTCCCSANIDAQYAMSCNREGLITIRHKDLGDLTANLLSNMCTHKMRSATHKMRKRKKGSTMRGFYKLGTEASSHWYFQYMEV